MSQSRTKERPPKRKRASLNAILFIFISLCAAGSFIMFRYGISEEDEHVLHLMASVEKFKEMHLNHDTESNANFKTKKPPVPMPPQEDRELHLARGVAGLPMSQTPALEGAERGKIECDVDANDLAYWNEPQGLRDIHFQSPFAVVEDDSSEKYLSFEPDSGGWNNIRMSLENMFVIAAATNRTLVLPPEQPVYLLNYDKKKHHRGFADFYPIYKPYFRNRLKIITTEEFLQREGDANGRLPISEELKERVMKAHQVCERRAKSSISCFAVYDHLRSVGYVPSIDGNKNCFVFDTDAYQGNKMTTAHSRAAKNFCSVCLGNST